MLQTHHLTPSILFSHRFNFHLFSIPVYVGKPPSYLHTSPLTVSHRSRVGGCWSTSLAAALNKEGWEMVEGSWAWNFPQNLKVPKSPLKKWWQHQKISWNKHRCQISRTWTFSSASCGCFCLAGTPNKKNVTWNHPKANCLPTTLVFLLGCFPKVFSQNKHPKKHPKNHHSSTNLTICFPQVVTFRSTSSWGFRTIQDFTSEGDIKSYFRSCPDELKVVVS